MAKFRIYLLYHIIYWDNKLVKRIIYILFLLDTIASYTLTYKRSILYADQKNYIINKEA